MKHIKTIKLVSYNIVDAEKTLIKQILIDNPTISLRNASKELGVSERTLYRLILKYDLEPITAKSLRKENRVKNARQLLISAGYKVSLIK